jgi:hypothetical protein
MEKEISNFTENEAKREESDVYTFFSFLYSFFGQRWSVQLNILTFIRIWVGIYYD